MIGNFDIKIGRNVPQINESLCVGSTNFYTLMLRFPCIPANILVIIHTLRHEQIRNIQKISCKL